VVRKPERQEIFFVKAESRLTDKKYYAILLLLRSRKMPADKEMAHKKRFEKTNPISRKMQCDSGLG
jgi:hypothetical protein